MIALSIIAKFLTQYFPIAGVMTLRFDFYGPFEKLPSVLFGPIIGGTVGSLVDFLGYVLANKTAMGYVPLLTITAFINCAGFAMLWIWLKKVNKKTLQAIYMIISGLILIIGIVNTYIIQNQVASYYYNQLLKLEDKKDYVSIGLIIVGVLAFVFIVINLIIMKLSNKPFLTENFFKLFIALLIPGILVTIMNTGILILFLDMFHDKVFGLFLIPRLGSQVVETFYETYLLGTILSIMGPIIARRNASAKV